MLTCQSRHDVAFRSALELEMKAFVKAWAMYKRLPCPAPWERTLLPTFTNNNTHSYHIYLLSPYIISPQDPTHGSQHKHNEGLRHSPRPGLLCHRHGLHARHLHVPGHVGDRCVQLGRRVDPLGLLRHGWFMQRRRPSLSGWQQPLLLLLGS